MTVTVFQNLPPAEMAVSTRIVTKNAARRIYRAAFEYAKEFGYRSVTVCEMSEWLHVILRTVTL